MWEVAIATGGAILGVIVSIIGAAWIVRGTISETGQRLSDKIDATDQRITHNLADHQEEDDKNFAHVNGQLANIPQIVGEVGHALREKINQVEMWVRDNYMRRDSFLEFARSLREDHKEMREGVAAGMKEIKEQMNRIEGKVDRDRE